MFGAWPLRLGRRGVPSLLNAAAASTRARAAPHAGVATGAAASLNSMLDTDAEVLVEVQHGLLRAAVMNRPKALNAVNLSMVQRLTELYDTCVRAIRPPSQRPRRAAARTLTPPPLRAQLGKAAARARRDAQGRGRQGVLRRRRRARAGGFAVGAAAARRRSHRVLSRGGLVGLQNRKLLQAARGHHGRHRHGAHRLARCAAAPRPRGDPRTRVRRRVGARGCRSTARCALPPRTRCLPCRRRSSASSPTLAPRTS